MIDEKTLEKVEEKIKDLEGTYQTFLLSDADKKKILEKEKEAADNVMMGLGEGDNKAVKKILREKEVCITFVTDKKFEWPSGPRIILKMEDEIIGKEIAEEEEKEEIKQKEEVITQGNFVLYKNKISDFSINSKKKPTVVFPPLKFEPIKEIDGVRDAFFGSPSPPAHNYLEKKIGEELDEEFGTGIVGFDLE